MTVNSVTITISSDAVNVAAVRCLSQQMGPLLDLEFDPDQLALLTSEVVTNAVRADAGEVIATFRPGSHGNALRVEVHDNGGGWPVLRCPGPLDERGGRGLMIVDALADDWGSATDDGGTTVWFEMQADSTPARGLRPAGHFAEP